VYHSFLSAEEIPENDSQESAIICGRTKELAAAIDKNRFGCKEKS